MSSPAWPVLAPVFEPVSQIASLLGESPLWVAGEQALYWVDIAGDAIHRRTADGIQQSWSCEDAPACLAPATDGRLVVGLRSGVGLFQPQDGHLHLLAAAPYDTASSRCNDGRCDPQGRFWVGTVFEPKTADRACLYCLEPDPGTSTGWILRAHLNDNLTANGLAFSADSGMAWWSHTPRHVIWQFPFDGVSGTFGARRVFHQFPTRTADQPYGGRPDGACLDNTGAYWVAMYEGGQVLRLDAAGDILLAVTVPVTCPTMVCLGGPNLRTLYVTTASKGRPAAERAAEPLAGHVLAISLDSLGLPPAVHGIAPDVWQG